MHTKMKQSLIAPCGINCAVCLGYMRDKNKCDGCFTDSPDKPHHCHICTIKSCEWLAKGKTKYCSGCEKFPCKRIKELDKRYKMKYGISPLENLADIKKEGIRKFTASEKTKWVCPQCGHTLCVHRERCTVCRYLREFYKK